MSPALLAAREITGIVRRKRLRRACNHTGAKGGGGMFTVLVVEDDPQVARCVQRIARRFGETVLATNVAAAERAVATWKRFGAFVIDEGLPDGSGTDFLTRARTRHPDTPAAIYSGLLTSRVVHAARDLRAEYISKKDGFERLERFLREAASRAVTGSDPIATTAASWAVEYALAPVENEVLLGRGNGLSCKEIARRRGTSPRTVKAQQKRVREKTGDASFRAAVERMIREAARGHR
jgi:DNA-binding NarL/FixJ family response regulator